MLALLGQTWRSVASVFISVFLMVGSIFWAPEQYNQVLDLSAEITQFIVGQVEDRAGSQGKAIARTMLTENSFTATVYFLVTRVVILTFLIFLVRTLYGLMFPSARREA